MTGSSVPRKGTFYGPDGLWHDRTFTPSALGVSAWVHYDLETNQSVDFAIDDTRPPAYSSAAIGLPIAASYVPGVVQLADFITDNPTPDSLPWNLIEPGTYRVAGTVAAYEGGTGPTTIGGDESYVLFDLTTIDRYAIIPVVSIEPSNPGSGYRPFGGYIQSLDPPSTNPWQKSFDAYIVANPAYWEVPTAPLGIRFGTQSDSGPIVGTLDLEITFYIVRIA